MKPLPSFSLHRPQTLTQAVTLLEELEEARPIAGGTDLLPFLRDGTVKAKHLIDLGLIEELRYVHEEGGEIRIGAATTLSQIQTSTIIREKAPALAEAASVLGSPQIRNRGTIGGNLCNASPAADTAPPLLALDARAEIASISGSRRIPLIQLFAGPKLSSLKPGELLTEVSFPTPPIGAGTSFQKLGRRRGYTLSVVNVAAYVELDGGACRRARLSLGAVAPTPIRVEAVEQMLEGEVITQKLVEDSADACHGLVCPVDDIRGSADYRREMSCVLARRTLTEAWKRARRSKP